MQDREDLHAFVEAFSGGHRDVLDFLAEEVLHRQPESVREFLLQTGQSQGLGFDLGALRRRLPTVHRGGLMVERAPPKQRTELEGRKAKNCPEPPVLPARALRDGASFHCGVGVPAGVDDPDSEVLYPHISTFRLMSASPA